MITFLVPDRINDLLLGDWIDGVVLGLHHNQVVFRAGVRRGGGGRIFTSFLFFVAIWIQSHPHPVFFNKIINEMYNTLFNNVLPGLVLSASAIGSSSSLEIIRTTSSSPAVAVTTPPTARS